MGSSLSDDQETLRLWQSLLASIKRRGVDSHTAEDIVQETWLRTLRRRPVDHGGLNGWLHVVAFNLVNELRRRPSSRVPREQELQASSIASPLESSFLVRLVDELPLPYRDVVRLRYLEERDFSDIALLLRRSPATVRSQAKRGLAHLRMRLEPARRRRFSALLPVLARWPRRRAWSAARYARVQPMQSWIAACALLVGLMVSWMNLPGRQVSSLVLAGRPGDHAVFGQEVAPVEEPSTRKPLQHALLDEPRAARVPLSGRVLAPDGAPVAGAAVIVGLRDDHRQVAVTDERGSYAAFDVDPGHCIWASSDWWWDSNHCYIDSATTTEGLDLHLNEAAGKREIRVLSSSGLPLEGATIQLSLAVDTALQSYMTAHGMLEEFPATKELVTRADGGAWLTWPQDVAICARVSAPGEVPWIGLLDAPEGNDGIMEVVLPRAATLDGTLRDEAGQPARGAQLEVLQHRGQMQLTSRTGPDGSFRIEGLAPGEFVLRASQDPVLGPASARCEGTLAEDQTLTLDLELSAESSVHGTAFFDGRVVPGSRMRLVMPVPSQAEERLRFTDVGAEGTFVFPGCAPVDYVLQLLPPGQEFPCLAQRVRPGSDAQILQADFDPALRSPMFLGFRAEQERWYPTLLLIRRSPSGFCHVLHPRAGGRSFQSLPLPAGDYELVGWSPDWGSWDAGRVEHDPAAPRRHRLLVPSPASVVLRLDLPRGALAAGFRAYVELPSFNKARLSFHRDKILKELAFDSNRGAFVAELPPGTCRILVRGKGFVDLKAQVDLSSGEQRELCLAPLQGVQVRMTFELPRPLRTSELLSIEVRSADLTQTHTASARQFGFEKLEMLLTIPHATTELHAITDQGLSGSLRMDPAWATSRDADPPSLFMRLDKASQTTAPPVARN